MQSQQKKVKWSRGETADALEERTDTGITQVSVSKLENIIADIYGNVSRRPAFKTITSVANATDIPVIAGTTQFSDTSFKIPPQSFVFTVDANTYIIFIADPITRAFGGLLIQNEKFVKRVTITNMTGWSPLYWLGKQISAAQYNNFMVVSNLYIGDVIFRLTNTNDIVVEPFKYSAPWYAPGGSQTKTVSADDLPGLEFNKDGHGFTAFAWTDNSGNSSPYSLIDTGLSGSTQSIEEAIPVGSIVKFPNLGAYMRVEGFQTGGHTVYFPQYTFDSSGNINTPIPSSGWFIQMAGGHIGDYITFRAYHNGTLIEEVRATYNYNYEYWFQSSTAVSGFIKITPQGWTWTDVPSGALDVQMFGPLLTPVANNSGKDKIVTVEYGYISLDEYTPTQFAFSNQRLYAAGFFKEDADIQQIPGYAVGSQIAKYNDFKNDYNTQSEAVVIDISTAYQEQIVAMIDYNGLKLLTDAAEYAYTAQGVIKQSENGTLATCKPLVFGSVCLYADKSGGQIRAMQYEFQSDLFSSSSINQMAKEDLIFNTTTMAGHLDKEHFAGRFLYTTQQGYDLAGNERANHALAVCNMVPGNQAMIWGRWTVPQIVTPGNQSRHTIVNAIEVNNKIWFVMACEEVIPGLGITNPAYTLAELDYDSVLDGETTAVNTEYRIVPAARNNDMFAWTDQNDPANTVYTHTENVLQGDNIYDADDNVITTASNSPGGPNIVIDGVGYYAWQSGQDLFYTKSAKPNPTGSSAHDESRQVFNSDGTLNTEYYMVGYNAEWDFINIVEFEPFIVSPVHSCDRVLSGTDLEYTYLGTSHTASRNTSEDTYIKFATMPGATVSVFDGDQYMWDDTVDQRGIYTKSLADLTNPRIGFMVNATLESHPIDVGGRTYTDHKRIGKAVAVIRDTEPNAFTVCDRTGYTSVDKKKVNFYGCTGMKDQIRYTIKNIQGAKFTIESLSMIIEYATLDS